MSTTTYVFVCGKCDGHHVVLHLTFNGEAYLVCHTCGHRGTEAKSADGSMWYGQRNAQQP